MSYLTAKEVAEDLGLKKATVLKYFREGFLPSELIYVNNVATYTIVTQDYLKWKHKHFRGVRKGAISKYSDLEKEQSKEAISEHIVTWLSWCSNGLLSGKPLAARTLVLGKYYMEMYLKLLGKYPTKPLVSVENLRLVLSSLDVERFGTKIKIYTSLMSFTKYLVAVGKFTNEEREKLKKLKPRRFLPAKKLSLDESQAKQLIEQVGKITNYTVYDRALANAIVVFLIGTGLRNSEFCRLKLDDVDLEKGKVFVNLGKGNKNRVVGISLEVKNALIEYLKCRFARFPDTSCENFFLSRNATPFTICALCRKIKRIGKSAGLEINPHGLRRTFASVNSAKGRPLNHLRIALGHSDLSTTQGYLMTTENEVIEAMKLWD